MAFQLSFVNELNCWDHRSPHSWIWLQDTTRHRSRQRLKPIHNDLHLILHCKLKTGRNIFTHIKCFELYPLISKERIFILLPPRAQNMRKKPFHQRKSRTLFQTCSTITETFCLLMSVFYIHCSYWHDEHICRFFRKSFATFSNITVNGGLSPAKNLQFPLINSNINIVGAQAVLITCDYRLAIKNIKVLELKGLNYCSFVFSYRKYPLFNSTCFNPL